MFMKMNDIGGTFASTFYILTNILDSARIEKVTVPKLVEIGSDAELTCEYSSGNKRFTVRWFFNDDAEPFYEWCPGIEPRIRKSIYKTLDLSWLPTLKRHTLKLVNMSPELSGSYACSISSHAKPEEERITKTMMVYSPVEDFEMNMDYQHQYTMVSCGARGLYPQPDLVIEYNNKLVRQGQHVWRQSGHLYEVKSTALLTVPPCSSGPVTCRLQLQQVDYTVIKKKFLNYAEHNCTNKSGSITSLEPLFIALSLILLLMCHR